MRVWGHPVTLVTDASALHWLLTLRDYNGKLLRCAMRMHEYDVTVQHRPGKRNQVDAPSRMPQQSELDAELPEEHADEEWPEAVPSMPAPPARVQFATDAATAEACSYVPYDVGEPPPTRGARVAMINGYRINSLYGRLAAVLTWQRLVPTFRPRLLG
jgi:hypothetical protein